MHCRFPFTISALVILTVSACSPGVDPAPPRGSSGNASQSGVQSSSLTVADQAFLAQAAYSGLAEVALGKLAEERAASSAVRDFGRRMVNEHGKANKELVALAKSKGMSPPTAPDPGRQAVAEALASLQGPEFDRQYLQQQLAEHEVGIALFNTEASSGSDPQVRAFAVKWLPSLRGHAKDIRSLALQSGKIPR